MHDRTINLDGQVSPRALEARLAGRTQAYVLETEVRLLVEWVGPERRLETSAFRDRFAPLVADREGNVIVLVPTD